MRPKLFFGCEDGRRDGERFTGERGPPREGFVPLGRDFPNVASTSETHSRAAKANSMIRETMAGAMGAAVLLLIFAEAVAGVGFYHFSGRGQDGGVTTIRFATQCA